MLLIITGKTCFKKTTGTSIDISLTNRPRSFLKLAIFETGLSDHHKLILSFFRSYFSLILPKLHNTGNIKHLSNPYFYMSWIKNF